MTTKKCPHCAGENQEEAIKCEHCGEKLTKIRPRGISFLAILSWIVPVFLLLGLVLTSALNLPLRGPLQGVGVTLTVAMAVISVGIGFGLWNLRNWARIGVITIYSFNLLDALVGFELFPMFVSGMIIWYMFCRDVKDAFGVIPKSQKEKVTK